MKVLLELFTASKCRDCPYAKEIIEKVVGEMPEVEYVEISTDEEEGKIKAARYGVTRTPSIAIDNKLVIVGVPSEEELIEKIKHAMEVRKALEEKGILIEIFRNVPPGKRCQTLTKNIFEAIYDKKENITVKLLSFPSPEAEKRGIIKAPTSIFNGKAIEGVLSPEEVIEIIDEILGKKKNKIGIIITKPPFNNENIENALMLAVDLLKEENGAEIFLLSDGVWTAKKGSQIEPLLKTFLEKGGEITASDPHLKANGLIKEMLMENIKITERPYDDLVDLIMEQWDRVLLF
ncbi:MAG: DsrH/TusB family sulfur metabolism protein [Candidatus Hydrothermarchaeota archaeon]